MNNNDKKTNNYDLPQVKLGVYKHYKGNMYEVCGVGLHTETLEPLVVYKPLYKSSVPLWVRPYKMFFSEVCIDGKNIPRFKKIDDKL